MHPREPSLAQQKSDRGGRSDHALHRFRRFHAGINVAPERTHPTRMPDKSPTAPPAFLTIDSRPPAAVRELMLEADGCLKAGFLTGGTVCAQRAIQALLHHEKDDGARYEARKSG